MINITIEGEPFSKLRPRIMRRERFVTMYDPLEDEKNVVKMLMKAHCMKNDIQPLQGALSFTSEHYFKIPESLSEKEKNRRAWDDNLMTNKPDIDNVLKFYLDCANTILFNDDSQIIHCEAIKRYSQKPRTEIFIREISMKEIEEEDKKIIYKFNPKELKDLGDDCRSIGEFFEGVVEEADKGVDALWASSASVLLINFAKKWSSKLTKIGKL